MTPTVSPALFDQFARGWRAYVLVGLIALLSASFGLTRMPPMDIDESRFTQATRQMVETGDYVRIRLQDAERNRKPIGIHWLQAASVNALEPATGRINTIWPYRLPSVLGLVLASLAALWGGSVLIGRRAAAIGASLYAAGILAGIEAMTAKTDSVLVGLTTLALAALARLRFAEDGAPKRTYALVFWAAIGAGILIKGPVTPLVAGLTLAALWFWEKRADWMKPLAWWPGPLLALAITLPWLIAIGVVTEGRFYTSLLSNELGPKLAGEDSSHGGPPGYHLLFLSVLIFPATYAFAAAARVSWGAVRALRNDAQKAPLRFLLAWAIPSFVFFELMPAKLMHYALPTYPAIALLCGAGLVAWYGRPWRTTQPIGLVLFAVSGALIVAILAFAATFMPGQFDTDVRRAVSAGVIGALTLAAAFAGLVLLRRPAAKAAVLIACSLVFSFSLRERLMPESRSLWASNEITAVLTRARLLPTEERALWVAGYTQPSLIFLTRTSIHLSEPEEIGTRAQPGDSIVIEGRALQPTLDALAANDLRFEPAEPPVRAHALSRGERVVLSIGTVEASGAAAAGRTPPT